MIARGVVIFAVIWFVAANYKPSAPANVAAPPAPVMGVPFTIDGFTVTLTSLRRIQDVDPTLRPLAGTELWVLGAEVRNGTGNEAGVGTGFRIQDSAGIITSANFISPVHPDLDATLAAGGHMAGFLAFSVPSTQTPVAVLVKPDGEGVTVRLPYAPWPSKGP